MLATGRILASGVLLTVLAGCAAPDLTAWFRGDDTGNRQATTSKRQAAAKPAVKPGWIADPENGCATSNPRPTPGESIRWFGDCENGELTGEGTLVWYQNGQEVERNEGGFRAGELHGEVVTTFDDGSYIVGRYVDGKRHGNFMIRRPDGSHLQAHYDEDELTARRVASAEEVDAWLKARATRVADAGGKPTGVETAQAVKGVATEQSRTRQAVSQSAVNEAKAATAPAAKREQAPPPAPSQPPAAQPAAQRPPATVAPAPPMPAPRMAAAPTRAPSGYESAYGGVIVISSASPDGINTSGEAAPLQASYGSRPPEQASYRPAAYQPRPGNRFDSTIQTALSFAGRDGPWIVDSRAGGIAVPQERRSAAAGPAMPAMPVTPVSAEPQMPQARTIQPSETADALFSRGYQLELAGQRESAARVYDELLLKHPSAPSALLANARLVQLRQPQPQRVQVAQATLAPATRPQPGQVSNGGVVAVNSPTPEGALRPASLTPGRASPSPALHRRVCSRNGLYESNSGWCGTVTSDEGGQYWVRVDSVHLRGFATIGITRSACTGNAFLTWFSRGTSVRVPKQCMTFM